ncbi:MAG: hypothetical protein KBT00_04185 [Bacteroidales bacterium]|nr:hypothetical protein [Candidatus Cacconaster merdequi]
MILNKRNYALLLVLALVAGYCLYSLFGVIAGDSGNEEADRYDKVKSDVQLDIFQNRLLNDEEYFKQTKEVSSLLLSRVNALADLAERSRAVCFGIEGLNDYVTAFNSLKANASSTELALEDICDGLERMAQGENVPEYEQAYNNAIAGFIKAGRLMNSVKSFVGNAGSYTKDNENSSLADLVSEWIVFFCQDAAPEGQGQELLSGMDEWGMKSFTDMLQLLDFDCVRDTAITL